jgi:hypothetical protein
VDCEIGGEYADFFRNFLRNSKIKILDLSENNIDNSFIDSLFIGITNNDNCDLRVLNLSKNRIAVGGAIRLSPALKDESNLGRQLVILDLKYNKIANVGIESLC